MRAPIAETKWRGGQGDDHPGASIAGAWRPSAGRDYERGRATTETPVVAEDAKDRQQHLLPVSKGSTRFCDFDEFERLVVAARTMDARAFLLVLWSGAAGRRSGEMVALEWADIDFVQRQLCVQRSSWTGSIASPKSGRIRYVPLTTRLAAALRDSRHLRGSLVLDQDDGSPLTEGQVQGFVRRTARHAGLFNNGPHMLRHTFCSHLAMRGAPARAIQELAGHSDLTTTQRYMHLSPAALDSAIRLLDCPWKSPPVWRRVGDGGRRKREV
jgi:integrase